MRALPILFVSVAILLTCEPSHIRPVKTGDTNDPVQTCGFELPLRAEFSGTNFAWIVPSSWDLLYTRDGGEKWSEITADTVGGFNMLSFIDEDTGWGISWSGKIWRTENGGETWVSLGDDSNPNAPPVVSAVDFKFVDKLHGWILGPFEAWRTMDGGNTWQPYAPPNQEYYHFYKLFFSILTMDGSRAIMELYTIQKTVARRGNVLKWDRKGRTLRIFSLFQRALGGLKEEEKSCTERWMEEGIGAFNLFRSQAKTGMYLFRFQAKTGIYAQSNF
jgi:hypothetical protein